MSFIRPVDNIAASSLKLTATPQNFKELGSFVDAVNKPDNRPQLVKVYGNQAVGGLVGLTALLGAVKTDGTNDEVTIWEQARLYKNPNGTISSTSASDTGAKTITTIADHNIITGDNVLIDGDLRARATSTGAKTFTVIPYKGTWGRAFAANQFVEVSKYGSEFAQGTDQPGEGEISNLVKRTQPYMITKYSYPVLGSQLGNISWVQDETGNYYWHMQGLEDHRTRVQSYHEGMALYGEVAENPNLKGSNINGAEGYISAVEDRGIIKSGYISTLSDMDELITIMIKERMETQYCFFHNVRQGQFFSDMIAKANQGSGDGPNYGMFKNSKDMALQLGFKGFERSGINFYGKQLPILINKNWGGQTDFYKGFLTPMGTTTGKDGIQAPTLELNVKGYPGGGNRWMESWVTGSVDGVFNRQDGKDIKSYECRSEFNLITRGANTHVLVKG